MKYKVWRLGNYLIPKLFHKKRIDEIKKKFLEEANKYKGTRITGAIPSKSNHLIIFKWEKRNEIFQARLSFQETEKGIEVIGVVSKEKKLNSDAIRFPKETIDLNEIVYKKTYPL